MNKREFEWKVKADIVRIWIKECDQRKMMLQKQLMDIEAELALEGGKNETFKDPVA